MSLSTSPVREREPRSLLVSPGRSRDLMSESRDLPSWFLTPHQVWDIELLLMGAFSPVEGFLTRGDYEQVLSEMRLSNGTLWPIPIVLDVSREVALSLKPGSRLALRHPEGMVLAVMTISDVWQADRLREAEAVLGTTDDSHPGVAHLRHVTNSYYVGGPVEGLELPRHHTFVSLRHTPAQLRAWFAEAGWERIVGFQTRNPLHRAHVELTKRAMQEADAKLLLQPVVGRTNPGDVDYFSRVRCYKAVMKQYPLDAAKLSLLPLAMRMGGPREAVWHALVRANFGCTHFIVGRDHAGPRDGAGRPFYEPYEALELARRCEGELGLAILGYEELVYSQEDEQYHFCSEVSDPTKVLSLSGTQLRGQLRKGETIPEWFSYPEVVEELRNRYPSRSRQGFTVFFTGLSGAGKSTIAQILMAKLMELGPRPVTLLDGDIVRKNLSSELGFSREHRDLNILRIGFVASEITRNRGVAICAPIAPYRVPRRLVRESISEVGGFIEVYVSTPLEVCEERDRKGLYAKARAGLITGFTGIDDPYEAPESPELVIDTSLASAEECAERILEYLVSEGFLVSSPTQVG